MNEQSQYSLHSLPASPLPPRSGYTPLHYACKFGRQEVARWVLASGARSILEARAEGGVTPLLQSAEEKQFHLIPMLLEEGANPAAMDTTFWQVGLQGGQVWASQHGAAHVCDCLCKW